MAVRRLNHAVLYVHGLERTVEFYRNTLGFEVRMEIPGRAAFLRAPDSANDHDLGLFEIGTGHAPDRPEHPGLYHLAWEVGTLADLVDTRAKLVAAGALVGESDHRVSKSLYAKGPKRHRVRGAVAGARAGLGGRNGQRRDDAPARLGRDPGPLGPQPGHRRGRWITHLSAPRPPW
jgi:catechol 2,3-dioxygenase-like lactoylglutathione lyase family enzyme